MDGVTPSRETLEALRDYMVYRAATGPRGPLRTSASNLSKCIEADLARAEKPQQPDSASGFHCPQCGKDDWVASDGGIKRCSACMVSWRQWSHAEEPDHELRLEAAQWIAFQLKSGSSLDPATGVKLVRELRGTTDATEGGDRNEEAASGGVSGQPDVTSGASADAAGVPEPAAEVEDCEHCQSCGSAYQTVYQLPDDVWEKVSPKKDGAGLLCPSCADSRARERGLTLYWSAGVGEFASSASSAPGAAEPIPAGRDTFTLPAGWTLQEAELSHDDYADAKLVYNYADGTWTARCQSSGQQPHTRNSRSEALIAMIGALDAGDDEKPNDEHDARKMPESKVAKLEAAFAEESKLRSEHARLNEVWEQLGSDVREMVGAQQGKSLTDAVSRVVKQRDDLLRSNDWANRALSAETALSEREAFLEDGIGKVLDGNEDGHYTWYEPTAAVTVGAKYVTKRVDELESEGRVAHLEADLAAERAAHEETKRRAVLEEKPPERKWGAKFLDGETEETEEAAE